MNYLSIVLLTKNTSNIPVFGAIWNLIVNALGWVMNLIYVGLEQIGIPNIGLAIIIFTIITRIIILPTGISQQKSSRMMKIIQPELKAIQDKYKNKNDQASMLAMQEETKALYQKYGTSMTGGCLPMLLQVPIIFALYRIIMNIPAYVPSVKEVYMSVVNAIGGSSAAQQLVDFATNNKWTSLLTGLHNLGLDDPSKYDSSAVSNFIVDFLYKMNPDQWTKFSETFPSASEAINTATGQINQFNNFLGLNLSVAPSAYGMVPNVYWLIPILAGLTQWIATVVMSKSTMATTDPEDQSAQMMKSMNIMMPLMSVFFCFGFASGIGIYWIISSLASLLQQLAFNAYFGSKSDDEIMKEAMARANAKRAKKGLAPINEETVQKRIQDLNSKAKAVENGRLEVLAKQKAKTEASTEYYNRNAAPGSLASKASMVQMFDERQEETKKDRHSDKKQEKKGSKEDSGTENE